MDWTKLDWAALDRLRDGFLSGSAASGPYWRSESDLANYDLTFGERIGWKWDTVLHELSERGWTPPAGPLLDWGCGSGIAGRRVLRTFGAENFSSLLVWDHSDLARNFSVKAAQKEFPGLASRHFQESESAGFNGTLVLSHVLNEISANLRADLLALARRCAAILWVEPGTHAVSRDLVSFREALLIDFAVVAPCPHASACGLFSTGNENHWCHFFATPPAGIYADSDWVKFGQRAGVDLRSLPYSFLVLEKKPARTGSIVPAGTARIIGRARHHKAHVDLLGCDAEELSELKVMKRSDPAFFKQLERRPGIPLYHWEKNGGLVENAEQLYAKKPEADA